MTGVSLNQIPCCDPKAVYDACVEQGLPTDWYGKPNRYACPLGGEPGHGHLLMRKSEYDLLTQTFGAYTLRMQSQYFSTSFPGILLAGFPRNLTPGSPNPVLMFEITDTRSNYVKATNTRYTWRQAPSDAAAVNEKTWEEAAEDLWNHNQFTQAWPGLPVGVHGGDLVVEQFDCHGFKIVSVLEDLLQALGCVIGYDPTSDSYSVQYVAGDEENIVQFARYYRDFLIHDETPYNPAPAFNVPEKVRVLFPVWSDDPATSPYVMYAKDVALDLSAGLTNAQRVGTLILQDKQPLRLDASGSMLNRDLIDDRAQAVADTFLDRLRTTTCQWPISRAYRGFIGGQGAAGLPGLMFDLVVWQDTGETGPMTMYLRQGIAGTGELYQTSGLPAEGLIETDHNPTVLYQNGAVRRAGGVQPAMSRATQNAGWWSDPARGVTRLVGSDLGPYMMRTQSLRYGEFAQVSTGGRGDLRGRLFRPWSDATQAPAPAAVDRSGFAYVYGTEESTTGVYPAMLLLQNAVSPFDWPKRAEDGDIYVADANLTGLTPGVRYDVHQALDADGSAVRYTGSHGEGDMWHTMICCGAEPGPPPPPTICGTQMPSTMSVVLQTPTTARVPPAGDCLTAVSSQSAAVTYVGEVGVDGLTCAGVAAAALTTLGWDGVSPYCCPFVDSPCAFYAVGGGCGNVSPWTHVWMSAAPVTLPQVSGTPDASPCVVVVGMYMDGADCMFRVTTVTTLWPCTGNAAQLTGIGVVPGAGSDLGGGSAYTQMACDGLTPPGVNTTVVDYVLRLTR